MKPLISFNRQVILDTLNKENRTKLTLDNVTITASNNTFSNPETLRHDSLATITAIEDAGFEGSVDVAYSRIEVPDLLNLYGGVVQTSKTTFTTDDFINELKRRYRIDVSDSVFHFYDPQSIDGYVTSIEIPEGGSKAVRLHIQGIEDIAFNESDALIMVVHVAESLDEKLVNCVIPDVPFYREITPDDKLIDGRYYEVDFSQFKDTLNTIDPSSPIPDEVAAAMEAYVTPMIAGTFPTDFDFSLMLVSSRGLCADNTEWANQNFTHYAEVFSITGQTTHVMHYNA